MKHKHKWQISHINNLSPQFIQDNILGIAQFEFAYIICEECGEVRKKKVIKSNEISKKTIPCETTTLKDFENICNRTSTGGNLDSIYQTGSKMSNEEIELKKEADYLKENGLPYLAKALNRLIPLIRS